MSAIEDDLAKRFSDLSVKHTKTWTMREQTLYKDAFKASEKESNFYDEKRDGRLENWVGFNPLRISKEDRCYVIVITYSYLYLPVQDCNL